MATRSGRSYATNETGVKGTAGPSALARDPNDGADNSSPLLLLQDSADAAGEPQQLPATSSRKKLVQVDQDGFRTVVGSRTSSASGRAIVSSPPRSPERTSGGRVAFPLWFADPYTPSNDVAQTATLERPQSATSQPGEADATITHDVEHANNRSQIHEPIYVSSRNTSPISLELPRIDTELFDAILEGLDPSVRDVIMKRAENYARYQTKPTDITVNTTPTDITESHAKARESPTLIQLDISPRIPTARKGKWRAVSPPRPARTRTGFWIASDNESESTEAMKTLLVESDRRYAEHVQELENQRSIAQVVQSAQLARQIAEEAERNEGAARAAEPISIELSPTVVMMPDAQVEPRDGERRVEATDNVAAIAKDVSEASVKRKKKRVKIEDSDSDDHIPISRMSDLIREQSFKTPVKKVPTIRATPSPAHQTTPTTYLGSRLTSKKRQRSESPSKEKAARMRGGVDSSGDSSDSSSETSTAGSSASERTRKRKKDKKRAYRHKRRALKMAAMVKMEPPRKYDGRPVVEVFERWLYEVTEYASYNQLNRRATVRTLPNFLTGAAAIWFMDNVAVDPKQWTLDSISREMFSNLFPRNITDMLRERYDNAKQGNMSVRQWSQHVKKLARRLTDISDESLSRRFWDGVLPYLRVKWTENGFTREFSTMDELLESAERYEAAEKQAAIERQRTSRLKTEKSGAHHGQGSQQAPKEGEKSQTRSEPPKTESSKAKGFTRPKEKKVPSLSNKEKEEHRAAGKCFLCHQTGHLMKDCPTRTTAKPPKATLGSINFLELEAKATEAAKSLTLGSMQLYQEKPSFATVKSPEDFICEWANCELSRGLSGATLWPASVGHKDNESLNRFNVYTSREREHTFIVHDLALDISYEFGTEELWSNSWDIVEWAKQKSIDQMGNWRMKEASCESDPGTSASWDEVDDTDESNAEDWEAVSDAMSDIESYVQGECSQEAKISQECIRRHSTGSLELMVLSETDRRKRKAQRQEGGSSRMTMERTAAKPRDFERLVPKGCVIEGLINENPVRILVDSGSMGDFISTTLVDQLKLPIEVLQKPLTVQLAVTGSRSKIQNSTKVRFRYSEIDEERRFDVINLDNYNVILGTPFLFQHKGLVGFNPTRFAYGSTRCLPIEGDQVATITSHAADIYEKSIDELRELLREEARDLCKIAEETDLPPFRAINHRIPLKTEVVELPFIPSRCPEALRPQWEIKRDIYLKSGRWRYKSGSSAVPMLFIKKKPGPNGELRMRTVFAKQRLNALTVKLASPLPDMEQILYKVASHKYRSLIDGRDAYEQIRVESKDVWKTLFNTPDGTMESLVMQQGDCNAGATYQTLMNHLFGQYIGDWMYVYLDDIVIFSDTIEDHVKHIRIIIDILRREKLYLTSADKLQFFANKLYILGHVIDEKGIQMDPHKVDRIENWKTPTNASLVAGFTSTVQYIAKGCDHIATPLAVLSKLQGNRPWKWGHTEQRAFEEVKRIVKQWQYNHRVRIDRSPNALPIGISVDASLTGAGAVIWQGISPKDCKIIAFWSGKFNSAEQSYPTHERELLAIVATLKKYEDILYGTTFAVYTDHEPLQVLMTQKDFSDRQKRWIEYLSTFDFTIEWIKGIENEQADALSRIYSDEPKGVIRANSEYVTTPDDPSREDFVVEFLRKKMPKSMPLYTAAIEAELDCYFTAMDGWQDSSGEEEMPTPPSRSPIPRRSSRLEAKEAEAAAETTKSVKSRANQPSSTIEDITEAEGEGSITSDVKDREEAVQRVDTTVEPIHEPVIEQANDDDADINELRYDTGPSLTFVVSQSEPDIQLPAALRGRYDEDPFFAKITQKPGEFKHFCVENGHIFLKESGRKILCIPDVAIGKRKVREILITHAHSILAHLGARKTLQYIRDHVWWKSMQNDIADYCKSCPTCTMAKAPNSKPYGLLRSLPVPSRPWEAIGIDFVGPLPSSSNRNGSFDMICVVIDHLTSMVHLVPTRQTYSAKDIAEVVFENVYKLHGLPDYIVSDRDSLFTSTFWKELNKLIGVELKMSSAYHPQTDGATERANRTIVTMLRQAVEPNQKDWVSRLPAVEFALNMARSETTGFSPFFLNSGRMPRAMIWDASSEYPGVKRHAQIIRDAIMSAHDSILAARIKQTSQANKGRQPAPFAEGDLVYLSTKNLSIPKDRARKLVPKFIGPFRIIKVIEPGATYRLDLPDELKARGVTPSFHASLLRIHHPNDDRKFPGRTIAHITGFGKPSHWTVEKIVSHYGTGTKAIFEVVWTSGDRSWELYSTVKRWAALDAYCEALGISSIAGLKSGSGNPPEDPQIRLEGISLIKTPLTERHHKRRKIFTSAMSDSLSPETSNITTMLQGTSIASPAMPIVQSNLVTTATPTVAVPAPPSQPLMGLQPTNMQLSSQPAVDAHTIPNILGAKPQVMGSLHDIFNLPTTIAPSHIPSEVAISQAQYDDYQNLIRERAEQKDTMQKRIDALEKERSMMLSGAFLAQRQTPYPKSSFTRRGARGRGGYRLGSEKYATRKKQNGGTGGTDGGAMNVD